MYVARGIYTDLPSSSSSPSTLLQYTPTHTPYLLASPPLPSYITRSLLPPSLLLSLLPPKWGRLAALAQRSHALESESHALERS